MSSGAIQGGFNKSWEQKYKHVNPKREDHYHEASSNFLKGLPTLINSQQMKPPLKQKTELTMGDGGG